jgi:DNA-3-methyladenine glycosylase
MKKLEKKFYLRDDVVKISRELLGKVLCTNIDGRYTSGIITETEAYNGVIDKASHAYNNRRTNRTEVMFGEGGVAYVYLCYGIHFLFNIVVNKKETPHAILVRAIKPLEGTEIMMERRKAKKLTDKMTIGPGTVSQALGITTKHTGVDLTGNLIWLEDRGVKVKEKDIVIGPRVGIDYAEEHKDLPYRFRIFI